MQFTITNPNPTQLLNAINQALNSMPAQGIKPYSYSLDMENKLPLEHMVTTLLTYQKVTLNQILYISVFEDLAMVSIDSPLAYDDETNTYYQTESPHQITLGDLTIYIQYA